MKLSTSGMMRIFVRGVLAALLVLGLSVNTRTAQAAGFVVNTTADTVDFNPGDGICSDAGVGGACSLRAAVMEANALPGPDVIHVPAGTYTLTIPNASDGGENASATGDLDIIGDLEIIGGGGNPDADPSLTVIQAGDAPDGNGIDKVLSFNPNFDVAAVNKIAALTIRNGYNRAPQGTPDDRVGDGWGGGLDWDASIVGSFEIYNVHILNNTSTLAGGGGVALWSNGGGGTVTIQKSLIQGNSAPVSFGGGVFAGPELGLTIVDTTIDDNFASHSYTDDRGAGGGLFFVGGSPATPLAISGSTISNNRAEGTGNVAGGGALIRGTAVIENSTISGNTTFGTGGGLAVLSPTGEVVTLRSVTVANNRADANGGGGEQGGGIWIHSENQLLAYNSLIQGNFRNTGAVVSNVFGTLSPAGAGNLTEGLAVGLGPLQDNGGPTLTHALLPGAPALDAGVNAQSPAAVDQRGMPRLADAADANPDKRIDIGAYEAHPMIATIADQAMRTGQTLAVPFRVGDVGIGITSAAVTVSNPTMFPAGTYPLSTAGDAYTLRLTPFPGQRGAAAFTVTVTYRDPAGFDHSVVETFTVTVDKAKIFLPRITR